MATSSTVIRYRLVCDECGRVEAFRDARVDRALRRLLRRTTMREAHCEVTISGLCERCAA
jgi:Fe2+ or Zn2+ uptake regulation protein